MVFISTCLFRFSLWLFGAPSSAALPPPSPSPVPSLSLSLYVCLSLSLSRCEDVASRSSAERTSLEVTSQVVEDLTNKYGLHAHQECLQLKHRLAQIQQGEVGRVPLHKFYGSALNGSYEFSESKSYLRIIGALDETDPLRPQASVWESSPCFATFCFMGLPKTCLVLTLVGMHMDLCSSLAWMAYGKSLHCAWPTSARVHLVTVFPLARRAILSETCVCTAWFTAFASDFPSPQPLGGGDGELVLETHRSRFA